MNDLTTRGHRRKRGGARAVLTLAALLAGTTLGGFAPASASDAAASGGTGASSPLVRSPKLAGPDIPTGATALGALPGTQSLQLEVALAPSDPGGLNRLLNEIDDPSSPEYHQWLAPGQFQTLFGPSASSVADVETWLRSKGITDVSFSGLAVSATAPASTVTAAFGTPAPDRTHQRRR
jgi:Pro-kumamolisin, activation domain